MRRRNVGTNIDKLKNKDKTAHVKKLISDVSTSELSRHFNFEDKKNYSRNLSVVDSYLEFCSQNGFPVHLKKRKIDLLKESEFFLNQSCKNIFKKNNSIKKINLIQFLEKCISGDIQSSEHFGYSKYYDIYNNLDNNIKPEFLLWAEAFKSHKIESESLSNGNANQPQNVYLTMVDNIFSNYDSWNKEGLINFKNKSKNPSKAMIFLIDYLFVKYSIPNPLYSLWKSTSKADVTIFLRISKGDKPKAVLDEVKPSIGEILTKKMVHKLMSENSKKDFYTRVREVSLEGYNKKIINAVLSSSKANNFVNNESILNDFFIYMNNQDLDMFEENQIMPLFDYVINAYQRARNQNVLFRLKDHSLSKLYDDMIEWHRDLGKSKYNVSWEKTRFEELHDETVREDNNGTSEIKIVQIKELLSSGDLAAEGREMKHCVASYAQSCKRGTCAIFSLRIKEFNSPSIKTKSTIELRNGEIVQIKAKSNQTATVSDLNIIKKWANDNSINIARYY